MKERLPLLVGLTFLAVAIGVGCALLANGIRDRNRNNVITVTGSAKREIVSDYIIWDLAVTSQQPTTSAALAELTGWTQQIRTFLLGAGAGSSELTEQPISTETVSGRVSGGTRRIVAFRLTRSIEVRSSRVTQIAAVVERSSQLFAQGVPIQAQPPQYVYTKLAELRPALLAEAGKDALTRARALVTSTGGRVGHLSGVDVGVFQVTAPNSTDVSDYGVYDTSTLKKDVIAVVNATFALG